MTRPADPLVSVIVPCYNEEHALPLLIRRLSAVARTWPCRHEIVCVDDGSRDATWSLLREQAAADPCWRAFSFSRNFGHQAAISAGLQQARGDAAVVIDADLQDPPELIAEFLAEWRQGHEVVYGVRESRNDPPLKHFLAWCFYRVHAKLVPIQIPMDAGEFALLDRKVIDVLNRLPERSRYLRGLRAWAGFRQKAVSFQRDPRIAGEAKYSFRQSLRLALDGIYAFSALPLRLPTWLGLAVIVATLAVGFARAFSTPAAAAPGAAAAPSPLITFLPWGALFLVLGLQLLCLGLVGEYIARVFDEAKARPLWIIAEGTDPGIRG